MFLISEVPLYPGASCVPCFLTDWSGRGASGRWPLRGWLVTRKRRSARQEKGKWKTEDGLAPLFWCGPDSAAQGLVCTTLLAVGGPWERGHSQWPLEILVHLGWSVYLFGPQRPRVPLQSMEGAIHLFLNTFVLKRALHKAIIWP